MNPFEELNKLVNIFPGQEQLIQQAEHVPKALLPEYYYQLLAHDQHMTVTLEAHYQSQVDVHILDRQLKDHLYCRKILLSVHGTDQIVQFGIVRFDLSYVTEIVRQEILAGELPLGRVLINHNVLRELDLGALLRITVGPDLAKSFQCEPGTETFGRLATIFCNGAPAVDLLEIPAPLSSS